MNRNRDYVIYGTVEYDEVKYIQLQGAEMRERYAGTQRA